MTPEMPPRLSVLLYIDVLICGRLRHLYLSFLDEEYNRMICNRQFMCHVFPQLQVQVEQGMDFDGEATIFKIDLFNNNITSLSFE